MVLPMSAPVAFLIFNRPEATAQSFAAIRHYRPEKLLIVADGPRPGHQMDAARTEEARAIALNIDWPCEVLTNFSDTNLGCRRRIETGLDWVFNQVEEAIIIEDDCVPNEDFWPYCEALLERYRDEPKIGAITGINVQDGQDRGDSSYYFSHYLHIWGWATWRRVWKEHDATMAYWPEWKNTAHWRATFPDRAERLFWEEAFERVSHAEIDTWDYPLVASLRRLGLLAVTPNRNLVANIGFSADATHTNRQAEFKTAPLGPLTHPKQITAHLEADAYTFEHHCGGTLIRRHYFKRRWRLMKWRLRWLLGRKSK